MAVKVQARRGRGEDGGNWRRIGVAGLGLVVLAGLFIATWRSKFAEPPAYLFGTPTIEIEAAYCMAAAQASKSLTRGRVTVNMALMLEEQAAFWLKRLRAAGGDLAGNIALGEAALGRDLARGELTDSRHLATAVKQCGFRAVWLGYRFDSVQ